MFGIRGFFSFLFNISKIGIFALLMFILFGCATIQEDNSGQNQFNSGPVQTKDGILFSFYKPEAKSVYIAGDFNGWAQNTSGFITVLDTYYVMEDENKDGNWKKTVRLSPGKYQYKFVVNILNQTDVRSGWFWDPNNPNKVSIGDNNFNSVIEVKQIVQDVKEKILLPKKVTNEKQETVQKLKLLTDKNGKINLAVIDLKPNEPVTNSDATFLSSFIRQKFIRKEKFNTLDKNNMDKILAEQAFQQTGCTTDECIIQMGNILNVNYVLTGNFGKLGDVYLITVQVTDVKTGKIIYSDKEKLNTLDPDLADEVVKILIDRFFNTIDF